MSINRFHYCYINIIKAYSFFYIFHDFIFTKSYYTLAVSEYIRNDSHVLDTAGGEIYTYSTLQF